jgi:hypothetical protein
MVFFGVFFGSTRIAKKEPALGLRKNKVSQYLYFQKIGSIRIAKKEPALGLRKNKFPFFSFFGEFSDVSQLRRPLGFVHLVQSAIFVKMH